MLPKWQTEMSISCAVKQGVQSQSYYYGEVYTKVLLIYFFCICVCPISLFVSYDLIKVRFLNELKTICIGLNMFAVADGGNPFY